MELRFLLHLAVAHSPKFDLPVVSTGNDERHRRVERGPVGAAVVAFEDVLDDAVGLTKQVGRARTFHVVRTAGSSSRIFLSQPCTR